MSWRARLSNYVRYNLLTYPVLSAIYVPYNLLFIGYTPLQLVKWLATAGFVSLAANTIIQPWISFCYRRKWLK